MLVTRWDFVINLFYMKFRMPIDTHISSCGIHLIMEVKTTITLFISFTHMPARTTVVGAYGIDIQVQ